MKKIVSCIIAVLVLAGAAFYTVTANKTEENLCRKFDSELSYIYYRNRSLSEMSASSIAYYTAGQYVDNETDCEFYYYDFEKDEYCPDNEGNYIKVDADKFDTAVKKCFNYTGDFRKDYTAEIAESEVKVDYYNEAENYYIVMWNSGTGGGVDYTFAGYIKTSTGYKAYIKGVNEDGSDLKADENPYYAEFDIEYSGDYLKVNDFKTVNAVMPEISGLITYPDVTYLVPDGITVDGDDCFEAGTEVFIRTEEDFEYGYDNAKTALKDTALNGKIVVFDISAYNRASWDGLEVQPSKPVKITFDIPQGLSADNLKMFYISDDGKTEEIKITVDKANNKVTAELNHFSVYAFCNVKSNTVSGGANNTGSTSTELKSPKTGYNSGLLAVLMLASLSVLSVSVVKFSKEA